MVMRYIQADAMHPCANGKVGWRLLTVGWRSLQAGVNKPIWNQKKENQKKKSVPTWVCKTFSWCSRCVFQAWRIHSRWFGVNTCVYTQHKHRRAPLLRNWSEEHKWFRWLIDALLCCCESSIEGSLPSLHFIIHQGSRSISALAWWMELQTNIMRSKSSNWSSWWLTVWVLPLW